MAGLVHIYEGTGKGKTTAGVGLAIRCAGNGFPVVYSQFLKDGTSGEIKILREIPNISVIVEERHFGFSFLMTPEEKKEARSCYRDLFQKVVAVAAEQNAKLLVMDEMLDLCNAELIETSALTEFLENRPEELEVVLTGRNPKPEFVALADYITDMQAVRHPFEKGIASRKGIEM